MPLLKYEQIAQDLRTRISNGEFGPADLLPSGRDLAEQWSVSRATVVKAYDVLRADGLVVARQGAGFTVAETPNGRSSGGGSGGYRGWPHRTAGGAPFRRLGVPDRAVPPPHVGQALGLGPAERALRRMRLMLREDGSPRTLVTAWFPAEVVDAAPRLSLRGPIAEGIAHYVRSETGRSPVEGTDITTVRLAASEEARLLESDGPVAVAVVLHVAFDEQHRPLVCEEGVTASHAFEQVDNYPMG
ncbi:GntR family transcriptional regulator [Streptomyces sp. NPDC090306]|uniref:GntR family transcriptional regulator n=1 Tax=unclassified Streptomyces TaxID=2593676 RepID=UPI0036E02559